MYYWHTVYAGIIYNFNPKNPNAVWLLNRSGTRSAATVMVKISHVLPGGTVASMWTTTVGKTKRRG
jgi:hypothetical protein